MPTPYLIVAAVSYILGAIPFGFLLVKLFRGEDIRLTGSGNIGATNVARLGAKGLGITTLLLDALKGTFAVWFAHALGNSTYDSCATGTPCIPVPRLMPCATLPAVSGHNLRVCLGFRGCTGVSSAGGWRTALDIVAGRRACHQVCLWAYEKEVCASVEKSRTNDPFLPGYPIPPTVRVSNDLKEALAGAEIVVSVMPSHHCRRVFEHMTQWLLPQMLFVS